MNEEIMPSVRPSPSNRSVLWIENLKEDRHYDTLDWVDPRDGELIVTLTRGQAEYLYDKLGMWLYL